MLILRAMLIWILALSLPIEGMAASVMTHCKDMRSSVTEQSMNGMNHHDHAAMMAAMEGDPSMAHMQHDMQGDSADKPVKALKIGCHCGCKCGGDCALSCLGTMATMAQAGFTFDSELTSMRASSLRSQTHAAYRYVPLRPPSAVAL